MSNFRIGGFIKDETYEEFKHPRGIYARCDEAKVLTGPWFKLIEKELFKLPYFIKKIPKRDRAKYLYAWLYDEFSTYFASDFTSYESHFVAKVMQALEIKFYKYMTAKLPDSKWFHWFLDNVLCGVNRIQFNYFVFDIEATRMSGEMNTSLGNGFSTLMLLLFVAHKSGYDWRSFRAAVEGDDSLSGIDKRGLKSELFEKLGFTIKPEFHEQLNTASFCGNIFDPDDLITITDIKSTLASFGWTNRRYSRSKYSKKMGLLRSKAMSLLYEYPGCPVLQSLASAVIRLTNGYRAVLPVSNEYDRYHQKEMLLFMRQFGLPTRDVPINTRLLVEKLYSIPVSVQIQWETYFDNLQELGPQFSTFLVDISPNDWKVYFQTYCVDVRSTKLITDYPHLELQHGVPFTSEFLSKLVTY
jgi:hypothetical protein